MKGNSGWDMKTSTASWKKVSVVVVVFLLQAANVIAVVIKCVNGYRKDDVRREEHSCNQMHANGISCINKNVTTVTPHSVKYFRLS